MNSGDLREKELLVRAAVEVVHGAVEPLKVWSPMLFPADGNLIVGNVQRAFPILFCCIRDLARAPSVLNEKVQKAQNTGFEWLEVNLREISLQCSYAQNFVQQYSTDEQIYLSLYRDRMVHGFLGGTANPSRGIWVIQGEELKCKNFTKERQLKAIKRAKGSDNSDALAILRLFLKHQQEIADYLSGIQELFVDTAVLGEALMNDHVIYFDKRSTYAKA